MLREILLRLQHRGPVGDRDHVEWRTLIGSLCAEPAAMTARAAKPDSPNFIMRMLFLLGLIGRTPQKAAAHVFSYARAWLTLYQQTKPPACLSNRANASFHLI